ncbi:hypothetical protein P4M26_27655 [Pseudomonas aeruginosa]|nr:hypothetical protein [Pseudomonas aeruginosa]
MRTWSETAGWVRNRRSAARVKLPYTATAWKAFNCAWDTDMDLHHSRQDKGFRAMGGAHGDDRSVNFLDPRRARPTDKQVKLIFKI